MCHALQYSSIRHENMFMFLSVSLPQTAAWLGASTHMQRTAAENNNSVLQRQQCFECHLTHQLLFCLSCMEVLMFPRVVEIFCQLCELLCLNQMSFQVVKVSEQ